MIDQQGSVQQDNPVGIAAEEKGMTHVADGDTASKPGPWRAIFANTTCVIASVVCPKLVNPAGITVPQGVTYLFPGGGVNCTLASGEAPLIPL